MSNIDIRKFVDVNIVHHVTPKLNTTRDTTVMFVDITSYPSLTLTNIPESRRDEDNKGCVVLSKSEALEVLGLASDSSSHENAYLNAYFGNGGQKLYIRSIDTSNLEDAILALPDEYIVIALPSDDILLAETINTLALSSTSFYGIKLKLAVVGSQDSDDGRGYKCVIKQYCDNCEYGAIAAYLSKIDISRPNSVKDYDFTVVNSVAMPLSDEGVDNCLTHNNNVVLHLAGQNRVIGGNTADGKDLVNEFILIVLQQTVTDKVLNLLVEKLKGEAGVAAIHTAIAQELNRYVVNGYLTTDKVWKDETLTVTYGDPVQTYTVIEQNTPLLLGYQIKVLPYAALTAEDKAAHKAPPIYLVLADSYGIRYVAINGEVF